MARIVVAEAGTIGASVAYHLASLGARDVTLADRGGIASTFVAGLRTADVLDAVFCATDGVADPPAVTRELVRRALKLGVELRERRRRPRRSTRTCW